jgi:hypothetical protein
VSAVQFIVAAEEDTSLDAALARMAALSAWQPFDERAMRFVARFSQRLLTDPGSRGFPELLALGHWFRAARLRDLALEHAPNEGSVRLGRGLAFHLAPANVDSIFLYSCLLSALAGNVNVVRLSQKESPAVDHVVAVLRATLQEEAGEAMRGRMLLLTYPHDAAITQAISLACMLRVVWGGDATVAAIRAIPLRPTATELAFPDRFSGAALLADAVLRANAGALAQLAADFYNDAFWFAQQACSSPRLVSWIGDEAASTAARERFWGALETVMSKRPSEDSPAMAMARTVATFEYAARGALATLAMPAEYPQRLLLQQPLTQELRSLHCGNGLFLEQVLPHLGQLAGQLTDRDQTLAVFGFEPDVLAAFAQQLPPRALDRIVPVGQALGFDTVWDGVDLLDAFTRKVRLAAA